MEKITIQVEDSEKAKLLLTLLKSLDFVSFVDSRSNEKYEKDISAKDSTDFFDYAGIWKNREISIDLIRRDAWPRQ
ncbi:MAG: hypothetical protein HQM12_22435 [SAR324 cluster bacterium]|nr:hypothetical protein [SAR324 cluster bacterium]